MTVPHLTESPAPDPEPTTSASVVVALCNPLARIGADHVLRTEGNTVVLTDPVAEDLADVVDAHRPHVAVICVDECGVASAINGLWEVNRALGLVMLGDSAEPGAHLSTVRDILHARPGGSATYRFPRSRAPVS